MPSRGSSTSLLPGLIADGRACPSVPSRASLKASAAPHGAAEKELYGHMTLFLQKLLANEPDYADDELDGTGSSSHITADERRDVEAYRPPPVLQPTAVAPASGRKSQSLRHSEGRGSSPIRRSRVLSAFDGDDDAPQQYSTRSSGSIPYSHTGAIGSFDSFNLINGRRAAVEGVTIILELAKDEQAMKRLSYRCRRRLYQIVQCYAVYANGNVCVRNEVADHVTALLGICFAWKEVDDEEHMAAVASGSVTSPPVSGFTSPVMPSSPVARAKARRAGGPGSPAFAFPSSPTASAAVDFALAMGMQEEARPPIRRTVSEVAVLRAHLEACRVPVSIVSELCECYCLEMLVDVGLPPSVCSSRFEGIMTILWERRGRVVGTIIASKAVLTLLLKAITVQQLEFVLRLGLCVEPRSRSRFFDRLVSEGGLGMLIQAARDGTQVADVLSVLVAITVPCMEGGKVMAVGCEDLGQGGEASPRGGTGGGKSSSSPAAPPSPSAAAPSATPPRHSAKAVQCTAWTSNPQAVCELLTVLYNTLKRRAAAVGGGPSCSYSYPSPGGGGGARSALRQSALGRDTRTPTSTLVSRMAEVLENIVCFSRHMSVIAAGVIDNILDEVLCPFMPVVFPAIIIFVQRKEAAERAPMVTEWLNAIAAKMVAVATAAARSGCGGAVGSLSSAAVATPAKMCSSSPPPPSARGGRVRSAPPPPLFAPMTSVVRQPSGEVRRRSDTNTHSNIRAVMAAVGPYLGFVRALAENTQWRVGTTTLFVRATAIAEMIMRHRMGRAGGRATLGSGTAAHVMRLVGPILEEQRLALLREGEGKDEAATRSAPSSPTTRKRARSAVDAPSPRQGGRVSVVSTPTPSRGPKVEPSSPTSPRQSTGSPSSRRSPLEVAFDVSDLAPLVGAFTAAAAGGGSVSGDGSPPAITAMSPGARTPLRKTMGQQSPAAAAGISSPWNASEGGRTSDRIFYSLSRTPNEASASPVAVVVPWCNRMEQRLFSRTPFADRSLDDDEDEA